jgi:DNA-binding GntR family transcriptional regulator
MPSQFNRPTTLSAEVHRTLRNRILAGELAPGTRLYENVVAEELSVSRTPVREAVRHLVQEGLVQAEPNRGVHVRAVTPQEALDAYELREYLEGRAASLAAQRASEEDVVDLEARLLRIRDARTGTYAEQIEADMTFHHYIAEIARNVPLLGAVEALAVQVASLKIHTRDRNNAELTERQHRSLFEAIARRDPGAAEAAAREHICTFRDLLCERLVGATTERQE